jgi:competence protein ComEA
MTQRQKLFLIILVFLLAGVAVWMFTSLRDSPVDINSASYAELDAVPYLTPTVAKGIITGRPFSSLDELIRVNGIGEATLKKIRPHLKVD